MSKCDREQFCDCEFVPGMTRVQLLDIEKNFFFIKTEFSMSKLLDGTLIPNRDWKFYSTTDANVKDEDKLKFALTNRDLFSY